MLAAQQMAQQRALEQADADKNATLDWLQQNYPEFAELPPGEGFQLAVQQMKAEQSAAGGGPQKTLFVPVVGTIDGQPAYVQFGNRGSVRPAQLPEGFTPQSRYEKVDLGNQWLVTDTTTGQQTILPKNGDVPTGFQQDPAGQGIGPMPGSPQEAEMRGNRVKAASALTALEQKQSVVGSAIDRCRHRANRPRDRTALSSRSAHGRCSGRTGGHGRDGWNRDTPSSRRAGEQLAPARRPSGHE